METSKKEKVIVIVGPTASGKTTLAIEVAKKFDGEVVSADSRQVYKGLDIGTGKVTKEEMHGIPHHLIDIADPMNVYTVSDFVRDGEMVISEIVKQGKVPILAGGSFFYIDSLLGKIATPDVPPNIELRARLEKMGTEALYNALERADPRRAEYIDPHNKRRLIRALEIVEVLGRVPDEKPTMRYETFTVGMSVRRHDLYKNIEKRLEERIDAGMIDEVKGLHDSGMTFERMEELGLEYRYVSYVLQEKLEEKKLLKTLGTKIKQYAKRQMTWLKRDKDIHWFTLEEKEELFAEVKQFLGKKK